MQFTNLFLNLAMCLVNVNQTRPPILLLCQCHELQRWQIMSSAFAFSILSVDMNFYHAAAYGCVSCVLFLNIYSPVFCNWFETNPFLTVFWRIVCSERLLFCVITICAELRRRKKQENDLSFRKDQRMELNWFRLPSACRFVCLKKH